MQLKPITEKRAAIELSIGTVVIVVIAMTMLILGIVLVRNIFGGATESVEILNDKVRAEITNIFAEEGSKIGIKLGSDRIAKIKQGTDNFGIGFGAETKGGGSASDKQLKYALELSNEGCSSFERGGPDILDHEFTSSINGNKATAQKFFEDNEGKNGFVRLIISIPKGTEDCIQSVRIHTYDSDTSPSEIASATFRIQVISGGIFS
jgi:hypothetical protein